MQTVTQDLRGDGSEIPFVDEGSDEDYRDAVRSQDGRKTYFWIFLIQIFFFPLIMDLK